jgi:hypothetical protein
MASLLSTADTWRAAVRHARGEYRLRHTARDIIVPAGNRLSLPVVGGARLGSDG